MAEPGSRTAHDVRLPRRRSGRHDDLPEGHDAKRAASVIGISAPRPGTTRPDTTHPGTARPAGSAHPAPLAVATALPADLERKLAELAGIEAVIPDAPVDPDVDPSEVEAQATNFAKRVLQVAQQLTVGSLLLLVVCAVVAARIHSTSLRVHPGALTGWGVAAAVAAVSLAALVTDPDYAKGLSPARRRTFGAILMLGLLGSVVGVVAAADGVAGPAWVLFLPIVVVAGAVLGPGLGLLVGALAGAGIYAAAGLSDTLTIAGVGRLVVILPACPLFGWAAGALAGCAHAAAAQARQQRVALIDDVRRVSDLLDGIAAGDLSRVPSLDNPADHATSSVTVVFADTVLSLRRLVRQLRDVTDHLSRNADELAGSAANHVAAVEQQASAVAQTTSTIEELAATATTISEIAERVSTYAGATRRDVDLGARSVAQSTESMVAIGRRVEELGARASRLDERVARVGQMARLIDELGRRTTMLGVNAAIEAARVATTDHGFATVAEEIGQLAARARAATSGIARVVAELEHEVAATAAVSHEGLLAVTAGLACQRDVEAALVHISARVDDTTRASHDITSATRQQRGASDAVVHAMHLVTGASHGATSATRTHAESAERLRTLMQTLSEAVARFRLD